MPDGDEDKFTEQEIGAAFVFLNELKINTMLRNKWRVRLQKTIDKHLEAQQKVDYLNNFLAENGFDVGAKVILHVLKTPWWVKYIKGIKSNDASDTFVQKLMVDAKLYLKWSQEITKNPLVVDKFLTDLGYQCTVEQVIASFLKMRRQKMSYWTGMYGKTIMMDVKTGKQKDDSPPALIIYKDHVSIGADTIFGWTYTDGTLTWPLSGEDLPFPNECSGTITFSQMTHPAKVGGYVGAVFTGIVGYGDKLKNTYESYSYTGQIGDPVSPVPYQFTPKAMNMSTYDEVMKRISQISSPLNLLVGMVIAGIMAKSLWSSSKKSVTTPNDSDIEVMRNGREVRVPTVKGEPGTVDVGKITGSPEITENLETARTELEPLENNVEEFQTQLSETQKATETPEERLKVKSEAALEKSPTPAQRKALEEDIKQSEEAEVEAEAEAIQDEENDNADIDGIGDLAENVIADV